MVCYIHKCIGSGFDSECVIRDPGFIRKFKKKYCVEVWAEHLTTKKKRKLWRRKDGDIGMFIVLRHWQKFNTDLS